MNMAVFYAALVALIPIFTEVVKAKVPVRLVPLVPMVSGVVLTIVQALIAGNDLLGAILAGLGVGAGATQLRQVVVKTIKSPSA